MISKIPGARKLLHPEPKNFCKPIVAGKTKKIMIRET
jgi:hypothetical protein